VILLHDPSLNEGGKVKNIGGGAKNKNASKENLTPGKTEDQINAEIEEKANARAQELFDEKMKGLNDGGANELKKDPEGTGSTKTPVDFGTKIDDMKAFAEKNEIDLTGLKKSDEIKGAIEEWLKDNEPKATQA
jgi:hypothetical protein